MRTRTTPGGHHSDINPHKIAVHNKNSVKTHKLVIKQVQIPRVRKRSSLQSNASKDRHVKESTAIIADKV